MSDNNPKEYSGLQHTIIFIASGTLVTLISYIIITYFINKIYRLQVIDKALKAIKVLLSILIIHKIKKTFQTYQINNLANNLYLLFLNLINIAIIIYINNVSLGHIIAISGDLLSLICITTIILVFDCSTKSSSYYIDNKVISLVYFISNVTQIKLISYVLQIFLALKLISVYKSINYILDNKITCNQFYLFLIFFSIISRFLDVHCSNILT